MFTNSENKGSFESNEQTNEMEITVLRKVSLFLIIIIIII